MSAALRLLAAIIVLFSLTPAAFSAEQVVDKIVAQVNGEMITLFDLNERVKNYVTQVEKKPFNPSDPAMAEVRKRILQTMVEDILLKQEAGRLKINIPDSEVESRIKEIRQKAGLTEEQFVQQIRLEGMSRKEFVEAIRKDILKKQLLGYMVQRKVVVTQEEVKDYYEANKASLSPGVASQTGQRIGLIMLNKMDEAKALRAKIASGQISFADAARKFSVGPGAEQGGDLGKVEPKDLAPQLRDALKDVKPGGVSEPVVLDGKPVLLTIGGDSTPAVAPAPATPSGAPAFETVKDDIYERIYREKLEKQFTDYMERLRSKSVIKINL